MSDKHSDSHDVREHTQDCQDRLQCLTGFILSRWYNPDAECVNYNSDAFKSDAVCKNRYVLTLIGDDVFTHICSADQFAWNIMSELCSKCACRSGPQIPRRECSLQECSDGVRVSLGRVVN